MYNRKLPARKKNRSVTHDTTDRTHVQLRALQRYGLLLSNAQIWALEQMVREGGGGIPGMRFVARAPKSNGSVWEFQLKGRLTYAIYAHGRLRTFVRPDYLHVL